MKGAHRPCGFRQSFVCGAQSVAGFSVSTLLFGAMFGIAATGVGLTQFEALLMSGLVFTASAQFAGLELWQHPLPLSAIMISTVLISCRHVLLGLALVPHIRQGSALTRLSVMTMLTDPGAIMTIKLGRANDRVIDRIGYFIGAGMILYLSWMVGTFIGLTFTNLFSADQLAALRFSGILVMATMMVLFAKGEESQSLPWIISAVCAAVFSSVGLHPYLIMPVSVVIGGAVCYFFAGKSWNLTRP